MWIWYVLSSPISTLFFSRETKEGNLLCYFDRKMEFYDLKENHSRL